MQHYDHLQEDEDEEEDLEDQEPISGRIDHSNTQFRGHSQ